MTTTGPTLTQMEMTPEDIEQAQTMGRHLGYSQMAYTSTSDLWGVFCLPENPEHYHQGKHYIASLPPFRPGCIIKTKELGLLFVQDHEDLTGEPSGD